MDPISMALFAGGMALNIWSSSNQRDAQEEFARQSSALNNEKTDLQKKQNEVLAARATRDAIRKAQVARGMTVNFAGNSGAMDSSGFFGGLAQVENQRNLTTGAISQDLANANAIMGVNQRISTLTGDFQAQSADNQFLSGLGSIISGNAAQLSRMGRTAFDSFSSPSSGWNTTVTYG